MSIGPTKYHHLSLRLPKADLEMIDRAARLNGRSRTEFIREASLCAAEKLILDRTMIPKFALGFKEVMVGIESAIGGVSSSSKSP